jgi:hypothetical protein
MTNLDPIAVSIIMKAVDFLFNQASAVIQNMNRPMDSRTVPADRPPPSSGTISTEQHEIIQSISEINVKEVQHCLDQIKLYTGNVQFFEKRIAMAGGEALASQELVHKLQVSKEELEKWIKKLQQLLEHASHKEIPILGIK